MITKISRKCSSFILNYIQIPIIQTPKGDEKLCELSNVRVIKSWLKRSENYKAHVCNLGLHFQLTLVLITKGLNNLLCLSAFDFILFKSLFTMGMQK